jgi:N-acetylmuramoyl-L-alanine amidase
MPATQATDRVLLQAGHSAQFPPYRTGGGGAPGEAAWATDLAAMLAGRLRAAGVEVVCIGAWLVNGVVVQAPALVTDKDYDLFLSLHYDAAIYAQNTGCIVARAANDPLGSLADRFIAIWQRRYPAALGIPLHRSASTRI